MKKATFGDFMKDYALDFSKTNTIIFGLNTGFGAGYVKLTLTWIDDLIKLLNLVSFQSSHIQMTMRISMVKTQYSKN